MEDDEESGLKNWKDRDVKTMMLLYGEIKPNFLKNTKKQCKKFI
jgi:hypothetical protein